MLEAMAMSSYDALLEEIDRIVNSPYPTQLKRLRDLLHTKCTDSDVSRWILSKPCQVYRLTRCILDDLPHRPYVLDIIIRLSHNKTIRDAFLYQEPTLLHSILVQAVQSHNASSKYSLAAVTVLSHPLPKHVGLPSEVQNLSVHLFDRAVQQPSVNNIRPLYQILKGTSTLLIGLLSNSVLLKLEDHLFDILRNLKGDDQSLSLFCLAIMKTLAGGKQELCIDFPVSSYDTQELLASTQHTSTTKWKPDTVQQFFTATKAQRTMQLIALRVMWACNASTGDSDDEKTESLTLANEIITAVPVLEREAWRKANVLLLKKFEEKVFSPSLDPSIRFQALCFLVRLTEGSAIPATIIDRLREIVLKTDKVIEVLPELESENVAFLVERGVFDENTTTAFIQSIVDFTTSAAPNAVCRISSALQSFLQHLYNAMAEQDAIRDGTMLALDVLSCGSKMSSLATLVKNSPSDLDSQSGICFQALYNTRNGLIHELCNLILRAALSSHQRYSIAQDTVVSILGLYASTARNLSSCTHMKPTLRIGRHRITFVESESTPDDPVMDWRDAVKLEINARADDEQKRLTAIFATSCKGLEARCDSVERPLRTALHERDAVQRRNDELQEMVANLEAEKLDRSLQFDALEADRDEALQVTENIRAEYEELNATCRDLESRLSETTRKAEKDVTEVKRSLEATQLENSAVIARKEEDIESLQVQANKAVEDLRHEERRSEEKAAALDQANIELAAARKEVEELKLASREQQNNVKRLTEEKEDLSKNIYVLTQQAEAVGSKLDREREMHQDSLRRLEYEQGQKLAAVEESYNGEVTALTNAHEQEMQGLKRKLADIESDANDAQARHLREMEQRDSEIKEKQHRINSLNRKCEQKDRQIAEANAMRANLLAAMGLSDAQQPMALPHRPSRSSTAQTSNEGEESQHDPSPPTPCSGEDESMQQLAAGQSFASNASSNESRSGPTPKRLRSKRSSRSTPPAQPRLRTSTTSRTSRSTAKRQPLMNISSNSPKKLTDAAPKTKSPEKMIGLNDTTFDGSELFAGTPIENV